MFFLKPYLLWGLSFVLVPIIIHLIQVRKYQLFPFSNLRFLKGLMMKKKNLRKWQEYLILLLRCLVIVFLVLAFAQPRWSDNAAAGNKEQYQYLVVDHSYSFELENEEGVLWDQEQDHLKEIINHFPGDVKIKICLTHVPRYWMTKEEALQWLKVVPPSFSYVLSSDFFEELNQDVQREGIRHKAEVWWLTDGQVVWEETGDMDSTGVHLLYYANPGVKRNLSIKDLSLESPIHELGGLEQLKISIENHAAEMQNTTLQVLDNGQVIGTMQLNLMGHAQLDTQLVYKNNGRDKIHQIQVSIEDEAYLGDNHFYLTYHCSPSIQVYEIKEDEVERSFALLYADSLFVFESDLEKEVNYDVVKSCDLVIINGLSSLSFSLKELLKQRLAEGKKVWWIPGSNLEQNNEVLKDWTNVRLEQKQEQKVLMEQPQIDKAFFKGIYSSVPQRSKGPELNCYFKANRFFTSENVLLENNIKAPLLVEDDALFLQTFPLKDSLSNFTNHALFVAIGLRIAELAKGSEKNYHWAGDWIEKRVKQEDPFYNAEKLFLMQDTIQWLSQYNVVGGVKVYSLPISESATEGFYYWSDGTKVKEAVAINQNRNEIVQPMLSVDSLQQVLMANQWLIKGVGVQEGFENHYMMEVANELSILIKICLLLVLIFIGIEITLIKIWIR